MKQSRAMSLLDLIRHGVDPEISRVLAHQRPWMNEPFFVIRAALYFAIWIALSELLRGASVKNDADARPERVIESIQAASRRANVPIFTPAIPSRISAARATLSHPSRPTGDLVFPEIRRLEETTLDVTAKSHPMN